MYNEPAFSNLIYEYFVMRFKFQCYKCGDCLPSIEVLSRQFSVSPLTVKAALKRLQDEGYVSVRHGKCTQVTFQQSEEACRKFKLNFFADRISLYSGFNKAIALIFSPLYAKSFQSMDDTDFTYLRQMIERLNPDDLVNFYCYILQKVENPLIMNLFWETSLFLGFPSLSQIEFPRFHSMDAIRERMNQLIEAGEKKNPQRISDSHRTLESEVIDNFVHFVTDRLPKDAVREPISFHWRIYRDRPQLCYSLATCILHHIYLGDYCNLSFLPSYQKMAESYGVSVSTIRRTIRLLNEIGAVSSINGKGTQILSLDEHKQEPNFSNPAIRRNLAYFINAFELLKLTIEGVSREVLPALPASIRNDLIQQLEELLQAGHCELASNQLLVYISDYSPFAEIREVYEKLYLLMLWGIPLIRHRRKESNLGEMTRQFTKEIVPALKQEDFNRCAELLRDLFARQYPIAEDYLLRQGVEADELRLSPAIKLMFTEEQ